MSVIIETPRETDFLLDIPIVSSPLLTYQSLAGLHDINPLRLYSNFTSLDMEQLQLAEFDGYKTFDTKFTPSFTGMYTRSIYIYIYIFYLNKPE